MRVVSDRFTLATSGKGTYEITDRVVACVHENKVANGTVTVFVQHTSCSLIIMENADSTARRDLERFFDRLVPENTDYFEHDSEGADDMPSHIRMVLTSTSETDSNYRWKTSARHLAGNLPLRTSPRVSSAKNHRQHPWRVMGSLSG